MGHQTILNLDYEKCIDQQHFLRFQRAPSSRRGSHINCKTLSCRVSQFKGFQIHPKTKCYSIVPSCYLVHRTNNMLFHSFLLALASITFIGTFAALVSKKLVWYRNRSRHGEHTNDENQSTSQKNQIMRDLVVWHLNYESFVRKVGPSLQKTRRPDLALLHR